MIRLSRDRTALLVVDLQERLLPAMRPEIGAQVIANARILIQTARTLGLPIVISQQYPKGLGATVPAIEEAVLGAAFVHRFDKVEFSAAMAPPFGAIAAQLKRDQWIVIGMETHVCVYQTARDLAARGFATHVPADAVASRTKSNWRIGLSLARETGAVVTSTEVCVFDLLKRAGSEEFKTLSKAVK
ncbi:MAG: isochorismatase family protein [Proteobacteria bacterium]|nr:isochorismatase family protein [Pseudomonadota bacterium]